MYFFVCFDKLNSFYIFLSFYNKGVKLNNFKIYAMTPVTLHFSEEL